MVDDITALWGLIVAMKSLETAFLKFFVKLSYACKVCIGHSAALPVKAGKKNSDNSLSGLARVKGVKTTPSGTYRNVQIAELTGS